MFVLNSLLTHGNECILGLDGLVGDGAPVTMSHRQTHAETLGKCDHIGQKI